MSGYRNWYVDDGGSSGVHIQAGDQVLGQWLPPRGRPQPGRGGGLMAILACGQAEIMPDTCVECGFWLHTEQRGGYPAQTGRVCSEDCAASQSERGREARIANHLHVRDLLCACEDVCAPRGLPSEADRAEYAAFGARSEGRRG